jgi:hypothetical protein
MPRRASDPKRPRESRRYQTVTVPSLAHEKRAQADDKVTITPKENILTLDQGDTENETIVVVITAASPIMNVKLIPTGATAPFVTSISPMGGYGPLAPNQQHTLTFDVTFTGVLPCREKEQVLTSTIDVIVTTERGERVADRKRVRIAVPACDQRRQLFSYSVKFVCGVQEDCACACAPVRPGTYATEINIYNFHPVEVPIRKVVVPVVLAGAPIGREPRWGESRSRRPDRMVLPPRTATMDDCCRIAALLIGGEPSATLPLSAGFIEIISTEELAISAVYTATDLKGGSLSIDVEQIPARRAGVVTRPSITAPVVKS